MVSGRGVPQASGNRLPPTRIARLRLERDLSREDLARRAGMSTSTLERIENHSIRNVKLRHLVNLALVLEVTLYDVIEDDWLTYQQADQAVPPPGQQVLIRPPGGRTPKPTLRERAPRRPRG